MILLFLSYQIVNIYIKFCIFMRISSNTEKSSKQNFYHCYPRAYPNVKLNLSRERGSVQLLWIIFSDRLENLPLEVVFGVNLITDPSLFFSDPKPELRLTGHQTQKNCPVFGVKLKQLYTREWINVSKSE